MKIFLLGYMGSGKSTLGKALSKTLSIPFKDLDQQIEDGEKITIPYMFKTKGELYFRKKEREYLLEELVNPISHIVALGGGTPCYYDNMDRLINSAHHVIYCRASIHTLTKRLFQDKSNRPLISHLQSSQALQEFIGKHLFERNSIYQKAPLQIEVDDKPIEDSVQEIIQLLH